MYFKNRAEAGRKLAQKLKHYQNQQCAVVALTPGGLLVGAQIAIQLHANLMILSNDNIFLPGESDPIATMTAHTITYNPSLSDGQLDEFLGEYHGAIEQQRIEKFHKLNHLLSDGGDINPQYLKRHVIILVTDALQSGGVLEVAADFLKPIKYKKLVIATPLATISAVDKMHLIGDDIYCLSVSENLMHTDHYYDENIIPDHTNAMKIMRNISISWDLSGVHV